MPKIMLVEDDNSLLEIYQARLEAEGFTVVVAHDGEEALTVALKEHPDLIIADVMMPKVSGFDMVDILRSTPETKGTKIIMMTALNQAEDKARAEKLGADRYLVKSQVTLEDVTKIVHEILNEQNIQEQQTITTATGSQPELNTPTSTSPAAKPATRVESIEVASAPSTSPADTKTETSSVTATPSATSTINSEAPTTPPKPAVDMPTPETTKNTKSAVKPIEVASSPSAENTQQNDINLEEKASEVETKTKADNEKPDTPEINKSSPTPKVTPISVSTSDDDDQKKDEGQSESSTPKTADPFLAQNPTLSDSATTTATIDNHDVADNSDASLTPNLKKDSEQESVNKVAEDAVNSLASEDKPTDSAENDKSDDKKPSQSYVNSDKESDANNPSLRHNKTIEPTLGMEEISKPNLPDLSAEAEKSADTAPPAVNSVITPDSGAGPAASSQT